MTNAHVRFERRWCLDYTEGNAGRRLMRMASLETNDSPSLVAAQSP
jgi:hypothetical protein